MPVWLPTTSFALEAALGNVSGYGTVSKFGAATDCDSGVATDIWDGADGVTSTDIWVAPTAARIHDIASASANDAAAGTGMRTVRVFGLQDWDSKETSEDITMNGVTNVPTANSYVIIHRIFGVTFGSGRTNAGIVTATAQTDATVTAVIQAGNGQTLMAIYGVPSIQKLAVTQITGEIVPGSGVSVEAQMKFILERNADQADSGESLVAFFNVENSVPYIRDINPPADLEGPLIIKMQTTTDTNNSTVTATFDGYVVDK